MYTHLAEIPVPVGAQLMTRPETLGPTVVQVSYSVKEHVKNTKRPMSRSIVFSLPSSPDQTQAQFDSTLAKTTLEDASDLVWQVVSPSGKRRAILRKAGGKGDVPVSRLVDVWKDSLLEASLDVTDLHGEFYTDDFLGSLAFAPSESALAYVAELKESNTDKEKDPYKKFRFNPDFGEGLTGKKSPSLFILHWSESESSPKSTTTLSRVHAVGYEHVRFGQPIFDPRSGEVLYATGYEFTNDGRMLGIKGCFNRPSGIWRLTVSPPAPKRASRSADEDVKEAKPSVLDTIAVQKLTPPGLSCRSPRTLAHNGKASLIWLSCASGGAHLSTSTLHVLDISGGTADFLDEQTLVDSDTPLVGMVEKPLRDLTDFPGLYPNYNLSSSPFVFVDSSPYVLLQSHWGARTTVLMITLKDGEVTELTHDTDGQLYSWSVLATDGRENVICSRSSSNTPYQIVLGKIPQQGLPDWYVLDQPDLSESVAKALGGVKTKIIPIPGHPLVEAVVVQSDNNKREKGLPPCITMPHGGPHGAISTAFSPATTAFALEGYTVSSPNYTGSPGYGEAFLQGLIGKCGLLDVDDCIAAAKYLISSGISEEGPGKQFIMGGSHGGFLTAHLIGRFPQFFSAAVLRNPVISVGEISSTDIPDWYFSEFGIEYPIYSSPRPFDVVPNRAFLPPPLITSASYGELQKASPITYIDSVDLPVLLMIGKSDRRVAPTHGVQYYHALKARYLAKKAENRRVDMLAFDGEGHPLDGVEASRVVYEAARDWFGQVVDSS